MAHHEIVDGEPSVEESLLGKGGEEELLQEDLGVVLETLVGLVPVTMRRAQAGEGEARAEVDGDLKGMRRRMKVRDEAMSSRGRDEEEDVR